MPMHSQAQAAVVPGQRASRNGGSLREQLWVSGSLDVVNHRGLNASLLEMKALLPEAKVWPSAFCS